MWWQPIIFRCNWFTSTITQLIFDRAHQYPINNQYSVKPINIKWNSINIQWNLFESKVTQPTFPRTQHQPTHTRRTQSSFNTSQSHSPSPQSIFDEPIRIIKTNHIHQDTLTFDITQLHSSRSIYIHRESILIH